MRNKKGFTLIEMVAIIILLALISLIVYPIISNIINDNKDELYERQMGELLRLSHAWVAGNAIDLETKEGFVYNLSFEELEKDGYIVDEDVINPKTGEKIDGCMVITYDSINSDFDVVYNPDCIIEDTDKTPSINLTVADGIINSSGYATKDFDVNVVGVNITSYKYCKGTKECEPTTVVNGNSGNIEINTNGETYVCVIGRNKSKSTDKLCKSYKLDKTELVMGTLIIDGTKGLNDWYVSDVKLSVKDIEGVTSILNINKIDYDTEGTEVVMTSTTTSGKVGTKTYILKVDKTKPTVGTLNIIGTKGLNDWYVSDVIFTLNNGSDLTSGHYQTTSNIATITSDTKGTNVIVTTIDKAGNQATETHKIKVDKTPPVAGSATFTGTLVNGWYTTDVKVNVNDGSDTTSGHNSTVSNITSITSNTTGTNVIITSTDNAGNKSTRTYTLKVDKDSPVLTAKASSVSEVERATDKNKSTLLYFNTPVYSISGGSVSCSISDIKGLSIGTYTITCKATGGNGKTTTASTNLTITQMTLVDKIKYDNPVIASNQTWTGAWTTSDPSGLYSENRYTDSGTTYYFRGQPNNYMTFAGQKFRIIRINEDGSVRLFLESGIGIYKFNSNYNIDKEYSGYTLSYYSTSEIKNNVDSWYNNISSDYKTKLASPTNKFCEAARAGYREGLDYVGPVKLTLKENYTPTFTCPTDGNGHGSLSYNVGLLTYDEALYAGGWYSGSPAFYLNDDKRFWTMSPSGVLASDNYPSDWGVSYYNSNTNNDGYLDNFYLATEMTAKPVINIKGDLIVTGYGTSSDPYVYTIK